MKTFSSITGQENAKKLLFLALKNNKIVHSYLFIGPSNLGKLKLATEFAKSLQCENKTNHLACNKCQHCLRIEVNTDPDVLFVEPTKSKSATSKPSEEKTISIDQVRDIEHHLSLFPYDSKYKIAIVNQAHKFSEQAANAFLKTLEEPRGSSVIILIAENDRFLPKTLLSRVQKIHFNLVADKIIEKSLIKEGASQDKAREITLLAANKPELAINLYRKKEILTNYSETIADFHSFFNGGLAEKFSFAEIFAKDGAKAVTVLETWLVYSHKLLSAGAGRSKDLEAKKIVKFLSIGSKILKLLNTSNINPRLAIEILALEIY